MQFEPATWARYQVSADPAKPGAPPDPDDPWDAIFTAARYLHASGAPGDWPTALYAYNHAGWYVAQAGQLAQHYAQTAGTAVSATARRRPDASPPAPPHQDQPRGSCPTGSPPSRRTRRRRCRPRSRPATGSSTPPTAPNASRTCSAPSWAPTTAQARPTSCSTTPASSSPQVDVGNRIAGDSTLLETYGDPGPGHWITVYASANHAFIQIAGIVLDTAHWTPTTPPDSGPRWQPASTLPSQLADGNTWTQRHPPGL